MSEKKPVVAILTREDLPEPYNLAEIGELASVVTCTADTLAQATAGADIVMMWDYFSAALREAWPSADALSWVHVCAAGVDSLMFDELRQSDVVVTNARGIFDGPIAEFVLGSILAHDKLLHESMRLQHRKQWHRRETTRTSGTSALVIGTGAIGRATARLLSAAGLVVTGAGRTPRSDDPDFGTVLATDNLADIVGTFDNIVLIAPLTPQTEGMLNKRVLAACKPSAHIINVGRGALAVEADLIEALRSRTIAAASLDVFATEPLPDDSPLWDMEQVAVSAHMSGDVAGWREDLADQFLDRLASYVRGESFSGVVDKERGYVH